MSVSYTHLRAHETDSYLVCRLLLSFIQKGLKLISFYDRKLAIIAKAHQTILTFVMQCKLPDPSEHNIKKVLYHLKLAP